MKCLLAGGAGFIGSQLSHALLNKGYSVICVDNLLTGSKDNIAPFLKNPKFTFLEYDVVEASNLIRQLTDQTSNLDYIFHLASPASPNKKSKRSYISHPVETLLANSQGTHNLLELARERKARFLYASSSEVYGNPTISPQNESYFGNVNPNGIRSVYDEGKRFGEAITMAYVRKHNVDGRIVRIFNTYGPKMQKDDGRVVSNFIIQALENKPLTVYGDGKQTRSFCYIDDMVRGLMLAMFTDTLQGEVINLGNSDERTILDLAILIKKLTNAQSEITLEALPEDDPERRKPDVSKAKKLLDWEPKVPIEEGLRKTIQYFKEAL